MKVISKEIDLKSLIIGFLLAAVLFLTLGAGSSTQDVRIVGVSTYDALRIKIDDVNSSVEIPIKIKDIKYSLEIPVKIEDQPVNVRIKK
ncbi:MAG: hypothetical protein GTO45_34600 [Candidatus Aminicenantes bacterium]|nr:hypothetical protein [Candidatus Aminicenantes bacterium]NIM84734.1 hypothetical protein [Candidatus Aminicenantes bacterium]NIN23289.1 hypothetical protein [Candidatus Aminicenantes bacterium]NIN46993.1 hypothetical protein [Candidatus Aminicenantes bacterium]NIN89915.1 hypothetical protein [Candidatus Aminicenantes bacterium]